MKMKLVRIGSTVFVLLALALFVTPKPALAAACTSLSSGNWNLAGRWSCGFVPTSADDVTIAAAHTITYDLGSSTILSLTVNGVLNFTAAASDSLTVTGNVIINSTSGAMAAVTAAGTNTHTLNVGGNFTNNDTFTAVGGDDIMSVVLNGSAAQTIGGSVTTAFENLTLSNTTATVNATSDFNVNGKFTINAGAVFSPTATTNIGGATNVITGSGTILATIVDGSSAYAGQYAFTTNTLSSMTVDYAAAGAQEIDALTYGSLRTSGSGTKTLDAAVTVNNTLTIGSGTTLAPGTIALNVAGNWTNNGAFTPGTATVTFNGSAAQTIGGTATTFYNLTINNTGGSVTPSTGLTIANAGSLSLVAGTFAAGTNLTMASTSSITRSDGSMTGTPQGVGVYDVTYTGSSKTTGTELAGTDLRNVTVLTAGQTLTLDQNRSPDGNLTVTSGIFDLGTSAINRSGAGGVFTLSNGTTLLVGGASNFPGSYTTNTLGATSTVNYDNAGDQTVSAQTYGNLIISGSGTKTLAGATTVAGGLTIGVGTTLDVGANTITVTGATSVSGTLTHSSATGTKTYTGLVTINSGGVWNNPGNAAITFAGGLTNNGSFAWGTATQTISGGNLTHAGTTWTTGTGSITFTGAGQQIICDGTHGFTIPTLTINGTVTNNCTGGLTVNTSLAGTSTLTQGTNAVLNISGTSGITGLTATASGNTVNYNGAAQTVKATTYDQLTFSGSGTKTPVVAGFTVNTNVTIDSGVTLDVAAFTISLSSATLTVNGTLDFTNAGGSVTSTAATSVLTMGSSGVIRTIDANGLGPAGTASLIATAAFTTSSIDTNGTVEYYRSSDSTGIITDRNYNNLTITNAGNKTWTLTATTHTVNGNVTINLNAPFILSGAQPLNVHGNWTDNGGTFTPGTSTVVFNGGGISTLSRTTGAGLTETFCNLTIASGTLLDTTDDYISVGACTLTVIGQLRREAQVNVGASGTFNDSRTLAAVVLTRTSTGNTDLGSSTTMTVTSNLQPTTCGLGSLGGSPVVRLYDIHPSNSAPYNQYTLRLYFRSSNPNESNGNTIAPTYNLAIYHCDGTTWTRLPGIGGNDGNGNVYVEVTGVDTFSPFAIGGGPSATTAVTLSSLNTGSDATPNNFIIPVLGFAGGLVVVGGAWLAFLARRGKWARPGWNKPAAGQ